MKNTSNEKLLEEYGNQYGYTIFSGTEKSKNRLAELKAELLSRMSAEQLHGDLKDLILIPDIFESSQFMQVFEQLKNYINLDKKRGRKKAKIIVAKDSSGSMGEWEREASKIFFLWLEEILRYIYKNVTIQFISYHTQAEYIDRNKFFDNHVSGGTIASTGLNLINSSCLSINYEDTDIYSILISDGDNLTSDNTTCKRIIEDICNKSKKFIYFEVNQYNRMSTLMNIMCSTINSKNFESYKILYKDQILDALRDIMK